MAADFAELARTAMIPGTRFPATPTKGTRENIIMAFQSSQAADAARLAALKQGSTILGASWAAEAAAPDACAPLNMPEHSKAHGSSNLDPSGLLTSKMPMSHDGRGGKESPDGFQLPDVHASHRRDLASHANRVGAQSPYQHHELSQGHREVQNGDDTSDWLSSGGETPEESHEHRRRAPVPHRSSKVQHQDAQHQYNAYPDVLYHGSSAVRSAAQELEHARPRRLHHPGRRWRNEGVPRLEEPGRNWQRPPRPRDARSSASNMHCSRETGGDVTALQLEVHQLARLVEAAMLQKRATSPSGSSSSAAEHRLGRNRAGAGRKSRAQDQSVAEVEPDPELARMDAEIERQKKAAKVCTVCMCAGAAVGSPPCGWHASKVVTHIHCCQQAIPDSHVPKGTCACCLPSSAPGKVEISVARDVTTCMRC
jgi:hypothetical protein